MRTNKIAAATALALATAGLSLAGAATTASATPRTPRVTIVGVATVTPHTDLTDGETVSVSVTGFPAADAGGTMYAFQCASQALSTTDQDYCDSLPADTNNTGHFDTTLTGGKATGTTTFNILTGSDFVPVNKDGKCQFDPDPTAVSNSCYVVIADTDVAASANVAPGSFTIGDDRAKSLTAIAGPKKAPKAGKKLKYTVAVAGSGSAKATGKVTITDNGKTVETDKVPSSGVIKVTEKKISKGKHKLGASYSGDSTYAASTAKTVKVKVKK